MTLTGHTKAAVHRALTTDMFQETKMCPATFHIALSQLQTIPFSVLYLKGSQMSRGMVRHLWSNI